MYFPNHYGREKTFPLYPSHQFQGQSADLVGPADTGHPSADYRLQGNANEMTTTRYPSYPHQSQHHGFQSTNGQAPTMLRNYVPRLENIMSGYEQHNNLHRRDFALSVLRVNHDNQEAQQPPQGQALLSQLQTPARPPPAPRETPFEGVMQTSHYSHRATAVGAPPRGSSFRDSRGPRGGRGASRGSFRVSRKEHEGTQKKLQKLSTESRKQANYVSELKKQLSEYTKSEGLGNSSPCVKGEPSPSLGLAQSRSGLRGREYELELHTMSGVPLSEEAHSPYPSTKASSGVPYIKTEEVDTPSFGVEAPSAAFQQTDQSSVLRMRQMDIENELAKEKLEFEKEMAREKIALDKGRMQLEREKLQFEQRKLDLEERERRLQAEKEKIRYGDAS